MLGAALAFARHGHPVLPLTWPIARQRPPGLLAAGRRRTAFRRQNIRSARLVAARAARRLDRRGRDPEMVRRRAAGQSRRRHRQARSCSTSTRATMATVRSPTLERDHDFPTTWRVHDRRRRRACDLQAVPEGVESIPARRQTIRCSAPASISAPAAATSSRCRAAICPGRAYAWSVDHHPADVPIAEAPAWLVEALTAGKQPGSVARRDAAQWAIEKAGLVTEYRDMAVASVAGKLLRAVSLDPAFVATLVHDWNACHCSPPLPERAVADILDRIANREIARLENSHA